jgi:heat shock protein HslJ
MTCAAAAARRARSRAHDPERHGMSLLAKKIAPYPIAVVLLAGCVAAPPAPEGSTPPLDGTSWTLTAVRGVDRPIPPAPTVTFFGGSVHGNDGCNRFAMPYALDGASLAFPGHGAHTGAECSPDVMRQADAFRGALEGTRGYRVRDGAMNLLSADGSTRAVLASRTVSLAGTRWKAIATGSEGGAIAAIVPGTAPTLALDAGGQASGSAGCNRFTGRWRADGATFGVQPAATTRMACTEAAMTQERAFLQALQSVSWFLVDGDRLELRRPSGTLAVALQREPG